MTKAIKSEMKLQFRLRRNHCYTINSCQDILLFFGNNKSKFSKKLIINFAYGGIEDLYLCYTD